LPLCRKLNIAVVPYSPLGRGFLSGKIKATDKFVENDFRRNAPRFQEGNFNQNLALIRQLEEIANQLNISPAQLALTWLMSNGLDIVPIPGTKRKSYLKENIAAIDFELPNNVKDFVDKAIPVGSAAGDRYPVHSMKLLNQ